MRKLCSIAGCPDPPTIRGKCAAHHRHSIAHRSHSKLYHTKPWAMTRKRVLAEQPLCECGAIATDVHHVTALQDGGAPRDPANLRSICATCHGRETAKETAGRGRVAI